MWRPQGLHRHPTKEPVLHQALDPEPRPLRPVGRSTGASTQQVLCRGPDSEISAGKAPKAQGLKLPTLCPSGLHQGPRGPIPHSQESLTIITLNGNTVKPSRSGPARKRMKQHIRATKQKQQSEGENQTYIYLHSITLI